MNHRVSQGSQRGDYTGRRVQGHLWRPVITCSPTLSVEVAEETLTCKTMIHPENESQLGRVESRWIVEMGRSKFKS